MKTSGEIIDIEEKRIEKEYNETGMIKCNLPFSPGNIPENPKVKWWEKIKWFFTKADITPTERKTQR